MNTGDELDQLYQIPLRDFVTARNKLAASVKKAAGADAANAIKTLAKPSASAWAVNQVYWKERWVFDALIAASDRLRAGIESGAVDAAAQDRQETVNVAIGRARKFLEENRERASDIVMRRIATTFDTLASYGSSNPDPMRGRLSQDLRPAGFGAFAGVAPAIPPPAPTRDSTEDLSTDDDSPDPNQVERDADAQRHRLEELGQAARRQASLDAVVRLETALEEDRLALAAATEKLAGVNDELDALQRRRLQAEQATRLAREQLEKTQTALDEARTNIGPWRSGSSEDAPREDPESG